MNKIKTHLCKDIRVKQDAKTICGKSLQDIGEDDYSTITEAVTCKDCLAELMEVIMKQMKRKERLMRNIAAQMRTLLVVILLASCAIPRNDKNAKCLKWEMGKCVWILNKDKEE